MKPFIYILCLMLLGCSSYQPTKNVWKTTKGLWNTYLSPPANVDYEEKAELPPESMGLSRDMQGIDVQLSKLERAMQNADKPPTQEWLDQFFADFPWLNGFAGVKYNGEILGQQPAESMKDLDFNPLLYEDKRQSSRALRADIQPSPLGPEIMLATPLYDGVDFLGIVVAYFDMRNLMQYSENPQDIVILAPQALLWPGKYDFAATPLAGLNWSQVVLESSAGTCSNSNGSFIYMVRYFGNLPLIFAIAEKGNFPEGNAGIEQGFAFFPPEKAKMPPPDLPERKNKNLQENIPFAQPEDGELADTGPSPEEVTDQGAEAARPSPNEIQPGSRESMLLKNSSGKSGSRVQERQLEGENVEVERVQRRRTPQPVPVIIPEEPEETPAMPQIQRPSPFGPPPATEEETQQDEERPFRRPSPFGPQGDETPIRDENGSASTPNSPASEPSESSTAPLPANPPAASAPVSDDDDGEVMADGEKVSSE